MPSPASTHQVDLLTNTLTHLAPPEIDLLKSAITTQTSTLLSLPFPPLASAQISLFHALIRLQNKYSHLTWHHQGLHERLANLGARIVQGHVAKGPKDDSLPKLWADIGILRVLPLIKKRCSLDPSSYALLNTRLREMRDEIKGFLLQGSDHSAIDERLMLLGRVAEFRSYLQEFAQADGELDNLIRGYAQDLASGLGAAGVNSSTSTTVVKEEEASSPSPEPPTEREELASSSPLATTATRKEESPLPSSVAAIKQTQPPAQSPLAALFAERAAREEARQKKWRDAERAEIRAEAKARQEAIANDPSRAEQRRHAEEMKAQLEKEAIAKKNVLASIEADKALRREKAEMTRLRRLQELETRKEEEKATNDKEKAKEMKEKEEADEKLRREEAGMTRLKRLQELETQKKEKDAKAMKRKEAARIKADRIPRKEKAKREQERVKKEEEKAQKEEEKVKKEEEKVKKEEERVKKMKEKKVVTLSELKPDMNFLS